MKMKATQQLHVAGQSLWLDHITRPLLSGGTSQRYVKKLLVTGLTSHPTICDAAIKNSPDYDGPVREVMSVSRADIALLTVLIAPRAAATSARSSAVVSLELPSRRGEGQ
ncbi:MAG: hypothetical protein SGJ01_16805 [Gemmatimonadota bacterium]|nr:hypothetical protein [Gemmatimonadota bacterium]